MFKVFSPANPPIRDWSASHVWIMGASSGIGRAVAEALLAKGAKVSISARNESLLSAIASQYERCVDAVCDVRDANSIQDAHRRIVAHQGEVDVILVCSGYYKPMQSDSIEWDVWKQHLEINVEGAVKAIQAVISPMLSKGRGHISLVGSVAGYRGLPNAFAYGPCKAAINHLADVLYLDLRRRGIGVSLICPGFVETPMTAQNDFKMPALMQADQAAQRMIAGWERGDFEIHFPRRFTYLMKLLRILPNRVYFSLISRLIPQGDH